MNEMILLLFVSFFVCFCHGFLLDCKMSSAPTTGSVHTDTKYDFVMQFVIQERQSRLQLQKEVKQLQQQLIATQTDLTNKINKLDRCTTAEQNHIGNLDNKTSLLENKLNDLRKNFYAIKLQNSKLLLENKQMRNNSKRLEMEVSSLLKSFSETRVIVNLQKQTNHLELEIKKTNSRQSVISLEAKATKQDFIALLKKLQKKENELHSNVDKLVKKTIETDKHLKYTATLLTTNIHNAETSTNKRLQKLESSFKTSIAGVQKKLKAKSNRGVLSACAESITYTSGQTITFSRIRTSHGINNLSSYKSSGIFTCENEGYYLISFFITTKAAVADMRLILNGQLIARATKHGVIGYQTNTAVVLYHLNVGDKISVRAGSTFDVWSCKDSFFNIVQII